MANAPMHRIVAATVVGGALIYWEYQKDRPTLKPIVGAGLAALTTNLPDILEPALHPQHRQFFHSFVFACGIGMAAHQVYKWQPEERWHKLLRFVVLVSCGAYLVHLALDSATPRSLPIIGKL